MIKPSSAQPRRGSGPIGTDLNPVPETPARDEFSQMGGKLKVGHPFVL